MSTRRWYQIRNAASPGNRPEILIYDEIDSYFGLKPADFMRDLAAIEAPEILVRINSPGGDIFDAVAILNALREHDSRIVAQVDGLAASAASFIAMAGDEIVMNANSQLMLHNAWALVIGDAADMTRMAAMLERQNANIATIYAARAGGTPAEWQAVMAQETWFTADEAVDSGLADRVIEIDPKSKAEAQRAAASFDRSRFRYQDRRAAPAPRIAAQAQTSTGKGPAMATNNSRPTRGGGRGESVIDTAIQEGKISAARRQQFLDYFSQDPDGCQRAIGALGAVPPSGSAASARSGTTGRPSATPGAMEAMYHKITNPTAPGPRNLIADHGVVSQPGEPPVMETSTITFEAMNARINADPGLQRMAWELGIRDGINKPPESFEIYPPSTAPGTPRLVDHGDGSGHWEVNTWPELR